MKTKLRHHADSMVLIIPDELLQKLNLSVEDELNIKVQGKRIIIETVEQSEVSLNELLAQSPREALSMTTEDLSWINARPRGKEII